MRVSVISPLFNGLHYSRQMLASLLATWPAEVSGEIILVDNGSTDGTPAWLRRLTDPRIKVMRNSTNLGYAVANNQAAAVAKGEFLILINNDVVLLKGWMDALIATQTRTRATIVGNIQINPRTNAVDHAGMYFDVVGQPYHFRPNLAALTGLDPIYAPAVTGACMMVRKEWFRTVGGFDPKFKNGYEDVDLCVKAYIANLTIVVSPSSRICHFVGSSERRHLMEDENAKLFATLWNDHISRLGKIIPPSIDASNVPLPRNPTTLYTYFQVFITSDGQYCEQQSYLFYYPTNIWTKIIIPISTFSDLGPAFRIDPCNLNSITSISYIAFRLSKIAHIHRRFKGITLRRALSTIHHAKIITTKGEGLAIKCIGNDPQLLFSVNFFEKVIFSRFPLEIEIGIKTDEPINL